MGVLFPSFSLTDYLHQQVVLQTCFSLSVRPTPPTSANPVKSGTVQKPELKIHAIKDLGTITVVPVANCLQQTAWTDHWPLVRSTLALAIAMPDKYEQLC